MKTILFFSFFILFFTISCSDNGDSPAPAQAVYTNKIQMGYKTSMTDTTIIYEDKDTFHIGNAICPRVECKDAEPGDSIALTFYNSKSSIIYYSLKAVKDNHVFDFIYFQYPGEGCYHNSSWLYKAII
ncbi:MAG: hypothetical protein QG635_1390 [Bacteroidota bacterium]|nr:hypothetical protein [Bacteroidota bacterium]